MQVETKICVMKSRMRSINRIIQSLLKTVTVDSEDVKEVLEESLQADNVKVRVRQ